MIRIHLTAEDIGRIRISSALDPSTELVFGGYSLAYAFRTDRLSSWRRDVTVGNAASVTKLFDLYSPSMLPAIFEQTVRSNPSATATAIAGSDPEALAGYLDNLSRVRAMTPFTRALAEGREEAFLALGQAAADLQTAVFDPYRRTLATHVAAAAGQAGSHLAAHGVDSLLRNLHPQIRWNGKVLSLPAHKDRDTELAGRVLVLSPCALLPKLGTSGDMLTGRLDLYYPAMQARILRDETSPGAGRSLEALVGATRAALLTAIARTPALTTGQLATTLCLSAASTSRQLTILRDNGLVSTQRSGMRVHHYVTHLGAAMVGIVSPAGGADLPFHPPTEQPESADGREGGV